MARIRSVHPGLFTDEAFVSLPMIGRVLLIGIWTECDDRGVFEWKPISLKMRIFPADDADVAELLEQLAGADVVKKFTIDGKTYGAVRNFRKYQRPKKPSCKYPLPDWARTYVSLIDDSSPPVLHQFSTSGEKSIQMDDGGGRREEERKSSSTENVSCETSGHAPVESPNGLPTKYGFEGIVIRLTEKDFRQWQRAYSRLDLLAELTARDAWLSADASAVDRKRWFISTSKYLANRNAEAKAKAVTDNGRHGPNDPLAGIL